MYDRYELIVGQPGTGKTWELMKKISLELNRGVLPEQIMFISFTKDAINVALERILRQFRLTREDFINCATVHASSLRLNCIRPERLTVHKKGEFWSEFNKKFSTEFTPERTGTSGDVITTDDDKIRQCYNWLRLRLIPLNESDRHQTDVDRDTLYRFHERYATFKKEKGVFDFTDLLVRAYRLNLIPTGVKVLFVDEAQDLSPLQIKIVEMWSRAVERTYVAGDDDQAIYEFQGSSPQWLINLYRWAGKVTVLTESHRVPIAAYRSANTIIKRIPEENRIQKTLTPKNVEGVCEEVDLMAAVDIACDRKDVLILARNRRCAREITRAIFDYGKAAFICERSGMGPNPLGSPTLVGAINAARKLHQERGISTYELQCLFKHLPSKGNLVRGVKKKAENEKRTDLSFSDLIIDYQMTAFLSHAKQRGFLAPLNLTSHEKTYVESLLDKHGRIPEPSIRVTTIHASKGREADCVFVLPDMSTGTFEEYRNDKEDVEHRAFYVAGTRTLNEVYYLQPRSYKAYDMEGVV